MVMANKIMFEIRTDSDCTTLQNMKKSNFLKSVCVQNIFLWRTITAENTNRIKSFFVYVPES